MPRHNFTAQDARFVWALGLLQLISWGSVFYGFALFMAPLEQDLQMSRAESSLGFSLLLLAEGVCAFPIGRWIDRGHERWVMTLGSLWLGLCLWAHSFVTTPLAFYAVWASLGVGLAGTLYPPAFAVLTRRFPLQFRRAIIILTLLGGLASTVFIPFIAWLLNALTWREALCVLAALHVGLCARSRLPNWQGKLMLMSTRHDFARSTHDALRFVRRQQSQISVHLRTSQLDRGHGMQQRCRHPFNGNAEMVHGALGLRAPQTSGGHIHWAQAVAFLAGHGHGFRLQYRVTLNSVHHLFNTWCP